MGVPNLLGEEDDVGRKVTRDPCFGGRFRALGFGFRGSSHPKLTCRVYGLLWGVSRFLTGFSSHDTDLTRRGDS